MIPLSENPPTDQPEDFKAHLIPDGKIIHRGIFSPDLKTYYYTISNKDFTAFEVFWIKKEEDNWTEPARAFFNSEYDEHGMSFSPDGNTLYFSSTRPVGIEGVVSTWHLWKAEKLGDNWGVPTFVDISNLRDKLVSHPTITQSGVLYFHSSNLDYSEMHIYESKQINGEFQEAKKLTFSNEVDIGRCTPYVSPKGDYLIFASVGSQLDLMISFNDGNGNWINTRKLSPKINKLGQGNPYVTPDGKYLFYTTGDLTDKDWRVKWVDIRQELKSYYNQIH